MQKNEVKFGAILSYVLIILNSVYGLVIAPYLMSIIGTSEYGVYRTIGALTASVSILDLGLGGTMQRYIASFNSKKDQKNASNFCAMGFLQGGVVVSVIAIAGVLIYSTLDKMYSCTFTTDELNLAKQLFILSMIYVGIHIFENIISGIVTGYNKFVFNNTLKVISLGIRIVLYYILLPIVKSALLLIWVMIIIELCVIIIQLLYIRFRINLKVKFQYFDKTIFKESFIYTAFMFIQSLTVQVNSNLDNIIIGSVIGAEAVAVYSFGILIFNMFLQISTAISGVMLPTITDKLNNGANMREIEDIVIKTGTLQFLLLGSCYCGFVLIGRQFIELWLGNGFEDVWWITLILITPAIFELSVNVCISVLRAKNKMGFRSVALFIGTIVNFIVTLIGTKKYGYLAAAIGTAISITVSSLILVNAYYIKKMKINMFRVYYNIIIKQAPILFIASVGTFVVKQFVSEYSWISFITKGIVFVIIEIICIGIVWIVKKQRDNMIKL